MNEDELRNLEKTSEVQEGINISKSQYKQENAQCVPPAFNTVWDKIQEKEKSMTMPPSCSRKYRISPWWLIAACLAGITIGFALPRPAATSESLIAQAIDTVFITERQTDTIYCNQSTTNQSLSAQHAPRMNSSMSSTKNRPQKDHYFKTTSPIKGESMVQEDFPTHLIVSL